MSAEQVATAQEIATKLRQHGKQAWLVGGVVRDLALGLKPNDVDLTTDAEPDELESIFSETIPVGRAFGTVIVRAGGLNCEVTTFRSESSYTDARHPDSVSFSKTPEEDALRRDFTCNAIYLDPLEDRILDPTGGLADLEARRLRCVGYPRARFAEDALRILRLARFAAQPGLEPEAETLEAARALSAKIALVAPERRLREMTSILVRTNTLRAIECLAACDALRWALFEGDAPEGAACHARSVLFRDDGLGAEAGLAVLFGAFEELPVQGSPPPLWKRRLKAMRPSREVMMAVEGIGCGVVNFEELAFAADPPARSRLIRALRESTYAESLQLAHVRAQVAGIDEAKIAQLARFNEMLRELADSGELYPELYLASADLAEIGIPRGARWGELLAEAETRQLDGEFANREAALDWLRGRKDPA